MLCPVCKVEMRIQSSGHILRTVDGEDKLFMKQDLTCRNDRCTNYEKVVETVYNELQVVRE